MHERVCVKVGSMCHKDMYELQRGRRGRYSCVCVCVCVC